MILSLSFEEIVVCRMIFVLYSPIVCVLFFRALLRQIMGRLVVFVGMIVVYGVLTFLFWVVSGLVLPWVMAWRPSL